MGGVEIVGFVCGGVMFVVSVVVVGFGLAIAVAVVGVVAAASARRFDLNLSLRNSLSACSFCSRD